MAVTSRLLPAQSRHPTPWRNGGGVTTQVAVMPPDATLEAFDWRVSMARVESDGPFSRFPGIDRTIAVLDGKGVRLTIGGAAPLLLDPATPPVAFRGDAAVTAVCVDGPIIDFNVMTRRGAYRHGLDVCDVLAGRQMSIDTGTTLILCRGGDVRVSCGAHDHLLASDDAVAFETTTPCALDCLARAPVRLYVVRIFQATAG